MATWTTSSIPDQSGKLAIITGATGGLGLETALGLVGAGLKSSWPDAILQRGEAQKL